MITHENKFRSRTYPVFMFCVSSGKRRYLDYQESYPRYYHGTKVHREYCTDSNIQANHLTAMIRKLLRFVFSLSW